MTEYSFVEAQPIQFNDCLVSIFSVIRGFFENNSNVMCFAAMSVNKEFVVSDTAEVVVVLGVPVPYLYWMCVIEFFHRLLPPGNGEGGETRTLDPVIKSHVLFRLSYTLI